MLRPSFCVIQAYCTELLEKDLQTLVNQFALGTTLATCKRYECWDSAMRWKRTLCETTAQQFPAEDPSSFQFTRVHAGAVRATGLFWNKDDLLNMAATPDHLLKIATQTRGTYPVIPPIQCLAARSDDEAASDPPDKYDEQAGENMELAPMIGGPTMTKKSKERSDEAPRLPIESRTCFVQQE